MRTDKHLRRWARFLFFLAVATALLSLLAPLTLLFNDAPLVLTKGKEVWNTDLHHLPPLDALWIASILLAPQYAWVLAVTQVALLARHYQKGLIFESGNTRYFMRLGMALVVMGVLESLVLPLVGFWAYYRGLCPWLPDMPLLTMIQPDLFLAGSFFFVLGKIMRRGVELQESERLTV